MNKRKLYFLSEDEGILDEEIEDDDYGDGEEIEKGK